MARSQDTNILVLKSRLVFLAIVFGSLALYTVLV